MRNLIFVFFLFTALTQVHAATETNSTTTGSSTLSTQEKSVFEMVSKKYRDLSASIFLIKN